MALRTIATLALSGVQLAAEMSFNPRTAGKVRTTFHLPASLVEEIRDTVVALSGPPDRMTMASFAEQALRNELERVRAGRPGRLSGRAYPKRSAPVRTGRPIS